MMHAIISGLAAAALVLACIALFALIAYCAICIFWRR